MGPRNVVLVGALGAAVLVTLGTLWVVRDASKSAAKPLAEAARDEARDHELEKLKARLARLEAAQRRSATVQAAGVAPAMTSQLAPAVPADERDPEVVAREQEISEWMDVHYTPEVQANVFGMYFADVDRVREAEVRDIQWQRAIEQGLGGVLTEAQASVGATSVKRVECGSTLCRIKLEVSKPAGRSRLVHLIQRNLRLDEASVLMPASTTAFEGYFSREGASLPHFDQLSYLGAEKDRLEMSEPDLVDSSRKEK